MNKKAEDQMRHFIKEFPIECRLFLLGVTSSAGGRADQGVWTGWQYQSMTDMVTERGSGDKKALIASLEEETSKQSDYWFKFMEKELEKYPITDEQLIEWVKVNESHIYPYVEVVDSDDGGGFIAYGLVNLLMNRFMSLRRENPLLQ